MLVPVEDYPDNVPIYVHCRDWSQFCEYRDRHPSRNCLMIEDDVFLRGRTPGLIVHYGEFYIHPFHQAIEEAIEEYSVEWKLTLEELHSKKELGEEMDDYGI